MRAGHGKARCARVNNPQVGACPFPPRALTSTRARHGPGEERQFSHQGQMDEGSRRQARKPWGPIATYPMWIYSSPSHDFLAGFDAHFGDVKCPFEGSGPSFHSPIWSFRAIRVLAWRSSPRISTCGDLRGICKEYRFPGGCEDRRNFMRRVLSLFCDPDLRAGLQRHGP